MADKKIPDGNIVVFSMSPYDFTSEKGEHLAGLKVRWAYPEVVHSPRLVGLEMFDDTLPPESANDFVSFPGEYQVEEKSVSVKQKNGAMSRVMKIVGVKFVRPWSLVAQDGPPAR